MLPQDRLLRYLKANVPQFATETGPLSVRSFTHGQSNPTYLLQVRLTILLRTDSSFTVCRAPLSQETQRGALFANPCQLVCGTDG